MTTPDRYKALINYFSTHHPNAETELYYTNPFELLIAVILSAQCTDKRVNATVPALFAQFPTPESLAAATFDDVFPFLKSISYPNNKTKHIIATAQKLVDNFDSTVPSDINALQTLPGVGRKTANVIASVIFNQPAMAVDTHVFRTSLRLGLAPKTAKTPLAVEAALMKHLPTNVVATAHHWLILHGRYICLARSPKCSVCPLTQWCKQYQASEAKTQKLLSKMPQALKIENFLN